MTSTLVHCIEIFIQDSLTGRHAQGVVRGEPEPGDVSLYPVKVWSSGSEWSGNLVGKRINNNLRVYLTNMNGDILHREFTIPLEETRDLDFNYELERFILRLCPDVARIDEDKLSSQQMKAPNVVERDNKEKKEKLKQHEIAVKSKSTKTGGGSRGPSSGELNELLANATKTIIEEDEISKKEQLVNGLINYVKKYVLVKGEIQSGKTAFIVAQSLNYFRKNISSIIVLRDLNGDKLNLMSRIKGMKEQLMDELKRANYSQESIDQVDFSIFQALSDKEITVESLKRAISGEEPRIFVTIGNGSSMGKIANILNTLAEDNADKILQYALFVDEVDYVDITTKGELKNGQKIPEKLVALQKLKKHAMIVYGISATILDTTLQENVNKGNVFVLTTPENYVGINQFTSHVLSKTANPSNLNDCVPWEQDLNLKEFLENFCLGKGLYQDSCFSQHFQRSIPFHCLMNIGKATQPQEKLAAFIQENYGDQCAVLVYNGKGVSLRHNSLKNVSNIVVSDCKSTSDGNGKHTWTKLGVSTVIQWMKNQGIQRFNRIITIAGHLAGRSISYVNENYGDWRNGSPGWRLTDVYMVACDSMPTPDLLQAVGRGCVITTDGLGVRLYATEKTHKNIHNGMWIYEELVERARLMQCDDTLSIGDLIQTLPISSCKKPKNSLTRAAKYTLNEVTDDAQYGGWSETEDGVWKKLVLIRGENNEEDETVEIQAPQAGLGDYPEEEFARLTKKMFPRWKTNYTSKIGKFMDILDPQKIYTHSEFQTLCTQSGVRIYDVIGKYKRSHGKIIEKVGDKFRLFPCLIDDYICIFGVH